MTTLPPRKPCAFPEGSTADQLIRQAKRRDRRDRFSFAMLFASLAATIGAVGSGSGLAYFLAVACFTVAVFTMPEER